MVKIARQTLNSLKWYRMCCNWRREGVHDKSYHKLKLISWTTPKIFLEASYILSISKLCVAVTFSDKSSHEKGLTDFCHWINEINKTFASQIKKLINLAEFENRYIGHCNFISKSQTPIRLKWLIPCSKLQSQIHSCHCLPSLTLARA